MPSNQYTPEQALKLLIETIRAYEPSLADEIQQAIDKGKDVSEIEPSNTRSKDRVYRKAVPFTHEEAIAVAIDALQGYFVEQPLFVESGLTNLATAAIGIPVQKARGFPNIRRQTTEPEKLEFAGSDEEKATEIELQTETQLLKAGEETFPLKRVPHELIAQQMRQIDSLRKMTSFQ